MINILEKDIEFIRCTRYCNFIIYPLNLIGFCGVGTITSGCSNEINVYAKFNETETIYGFCNNCFKTYSNLYVKIENITSHEEFIRYLENYGVFG